MVTDPQLNGMVTDLQLYSRLGYGSVIIIKDMVPTPPVVGSIPIG